MRIITGLARGRKLFSPGQSKTIRPTADRTKEALFSIIGDRVISAHVLDLYAGSGALGLEAWSRGAQQVVMVDHHQKALELIRKNCSLCLQGMDLSTTNIPVIIKHDLRRGLNLNFAKVSVPQHFDLILLDPPYGQGLGLRTLQDLDTSTLCGPDTLIIAEESSDVELPDTFSTLTLSDHRQYGTTSFWIYSQKETAETTHSL